MRVEITYLCVKMQATYPQLAGDPSPPCVANGSGLVTVQLDKLPDWLRERPGTLIVSVRRVE
jgi:hypothetical protein